MSWIEDIKTDYVITTGDGKEYRPNWLNANNSIAFNITEFEFPGVPGTFVDRREAKGRRYNIEIYFQGENNLDVSAAFSESSEDKRYWVVAHPMYGNLNVQPISLNFDDSEYNVTKITGTIVETITDINPRAVVIPEDKIEEEAEHISEVASIGFDASIVPDSSDINKMLADTGVYYANNSVSIVESDDGEGYFNFFNEAQGATRNAASDAAGAMQSIQTFLRAPAMFQQSVDSRVSMLLSNFNSLRTTISGNLENIPKSEREIFEALGAGILSSMALAASTIFNENDYPTRKSVFDMVDLLLNSYNTFLEDLDGLQIGSGGDPLDYVPKAQTIIDLNGLFNFTMGNLFKISFEAKQERVYTVVDDTNWFVLTNLLYGSKFLDEKMEELRRNNNLGLKGVLNIEKGIEIKYFV